MENGLTVQGTLSARGATTAHGCSDMQAAVISRVAEDRHGKVESGEIQKKIHAGCVDCGTSSVTCLERDQEVGIEEAALPTQQAVILQCRQQNGHAVDTSSFMTAAKLNGMRHGVKQSSTLRSSSRVFGGRAFRR